MTINQRPTFSLLLYAYFYQWLDLGRWYSS